MFLQAGIMFHQIEKDEKESKPLEKIQLKHLIIAFLILVVGWFVALGVFFCELIAETNFPKTEKAYNRETQKI